MSCMCTLICRYCVFTIHSCIVIYSICSYSDIFVHLFIIDYCQLSVTLCIILILEMYSRYFDPVNNNHLASQ
jgi:hypothetical protein